MGKERKIEWTFVLSFVIILFLWLFVFHKFLENLITQNHPLIAYSLFVVFYIILLFVFGHAFKKGFLSVFIGLMAYFMVDIWSPPIIVPSGLEITSMLFAVCGSIILGITLLFFMISKYLDSKYKYYILCCSFLIGIVILFMGMQYNPETIKDCVKNSVCEVEGKIVVKNNDGLSSDSFLYVIGRNFIGLSHLVAWFITYLMIPSLSVFTFAYYLKEEDAVDTTFNQ